MASVSAGASEKAAMIVDSDSLIARYIEADPRQPGPSGARLQESGIEIWALISYLQKAVHEDTAAAAADYDISVEAVDAALAYYDLHRGALDARIAWNAA